MEWIVGIIIAIIGYYLLILRPGRLDFWRIVAKMPDDAYDIFQSDDCWIIFAEKPNQDELPQGEWDGPFRVVVPKLGHRTIYIFGKSPDYEEFQKKFLKKYTKR